MSKDYLKTDTITRPICSIYELSGSITALAKHIYEDDSISDYVDMKYITGIMNPSEIATRALGFRREGDTSVDSSKGRDGGEYTAPTKKIILDRRTEKVNLEDLYMNQFYIDEINDYFDRQKKSLELEAIRRNGSKHDSESGSDEDDSNENVEDDSEEMTVEEFEEGEFDNDVSVESDYDYSDDD